MTVTAHVVNMTIPGTTAAPSSPPRITTGFAKLTGTFREPLLELHIHPRLTHPSKPRVSMLEWVKGTGSAWWNPHEKVWTCSGLNSEHPSLDLAEAGVEFDWDARPAEFADVGSLDDLAVPIAKLAANGRTVLVRPRLVGFERAKELLGHGAVWDKDRRLFRTPVSDVLALERGELVVRAGVHWPPDAVAAGVAAHAHVPVAPEVAPLARRLAEALDLTNFSDEERRQVDELIGVLPTDGRAPFAYQASGSLAVAAGRTCLFDEPGVGKSAGALYAARILGAQRTIVVIPPLLTTNWRREIAHAKLCDDAKVVTFKSGRKEPQLPDAGAVIVSDSLLASRPALLQKLVAWNADVMIVDEAHRIKTIGSARGEAVLDLGQSVKHAPFALTGTPIFASPHETVTMLELTRVLAPIFGGRHQFLADFCLQNRFGAWKPRKNALDRLHQTLRTKVWVRRRKRDVLPHLPQKMRSSLSLDVPLKEYRETHKEVLTKVHAWLTWFTDQNKRMPTNDEIHEWSQASSFTLISQLRQAAGRAKLPLATETIADHISGTGWVEDEHGRRVFNRPLLVWVHHKSVAYGLWETLPDDLPEAGMIGGATTDAERDRLVDDFQAGLVPVLICSITKAGIGLTLTRGSDAIFVETDWTPALIKQAEDRQHRPGATAESIGIITLVALGTLDETIQNVLGRKVEILEAALGDTDDSVAVVGGDYARGLGEIVEILVDEGVRTWKRAPKLAA